MYAAFCDSPDNISNLGPLKIDMNVVDSMASLTFQRSRSRGITRTCHSTNWGQVITRSNRVWSELIRIFGLAFISTSANLKTAQRKLIFIRRFLQTYEYFDDQGPNARPRCWNIERIAVHGTTQLWYIFYHLSGNNNESSTIFTYDSSEVEWNFEKKALCRR